MGLFDVLFGRKRLRGASLDKLFALSTAEITLHAELGLRSAGVAAVVFKPLSAGEFARAETEIDELLSMTAQSSGSEVRRRSDSYGFQWIVIRDKDFDDLVHSVHIVASELQARGFGGQLLAATFVFTDGERERQLIYGFKRGAFWPFVPTGEGQERDNPEEMRLKNELEGELPIEQDLSRWLALFDAPFE